MATSGFKVLANGCWEWRGVKHPSGYGMCRYFREQYVHRVMYILTRGPIPAGLTIDHLCRNRGCGNPDHLEPVTLAENIRRAPRTKLTLAQVIEIRNRSESYGALAKRFGVSKQAIFRVATGKSWRL